MNTVVLHPLRFQVNLFHKKGQQRNIELFSKLRIYRAKGFIIPTTIVGRQSNLHQQRLGVRGADILQNFAQGLLGLLWLETAQAVIAAKLHQHPARLVLFQQGRQTGEPLLGGIPANAAVNNRRFALPFIIQQRRPGGTGRHPVASTQTVTQN